MSPRLTLALDAAYKAGRLTLRYFQTGVAVDIKSDDTPVTAADRESEALIRSEIERAYPGEPVLGEEQGLIGAGDDRWVVDPIDGTKSFVAGVPLYAVLLSYEVSGDPQIGVCYFPALDEMLFAEKGQGAFLNGRSIRVSGRTEIKGSTLTCGSIQSFWRQGRLDTLMAAAKSAQALRTWCDAYGHALVASGRADAMLDPIVNRWDISAVSLIVREAGGKFTGFEGDEALGSEAISATPVIHATLVRAFNA
jgi:myo-inositol-1(or 4)-monophosphatase